MRHFACLQVVVAPRELHGQSMGSLDYDGSLSGEWRTPLSGAAMQSLPLGPRKIIAHRCMLAFDGAHMIVNLGVGMPEVLLAPTPLRPPPPLFASFSEHQPLCCILTTSSILTS